MSEFYYLTDENGVIIKEICDPYNYVKLEEGDRILRKSTLNYLSNTVDIKYPFIKVNPKYFDTYCKKYPILTTLACYIGYMDNIVSYDNGKTVQIKDLTKLCKVSESTIKRQLKGLIEDDIIHKIKNNKKWILVINPWLCIRGKRINFSLYEEFKLSSLKNGVDES